LKLINESAARLKAVVKIILMIELGNLREGVMPQDALGRCREIAGLRNLRLHGVGSIFGCLSATAPTRESLERLVLLRDEIERDLGEEVPVISGGSGSNLKMVMDGEMPGEVNHLRLGEAFFNGVEALHREPIPWLSQNVFRFEAQVLEVYRKPSAPRGVPVMDAFGRYRTFVDRGSEWRILLATGKNEVMTEDLEPLEDGIAIAGATGDQAVAEGGSGPSCRYRPGDVIAFRPAYSAVLKAFNSPHVHKVFKRIRTRYKGRGAE
jgi:predicted amino acid racemase